MVHRLREPEKEERKRFSMIGYKYRFTGRTQYQSQQAAEQISRSSQSVNRVAGDRFTWDRTLDPGQSALHPSLSPAPRPGIALTRIVLPTNLTSETENLVLDQDIWFCDV